MKALFVLNDPPYGTERSYNGFRLARALAKHEANEIRVFLLGDAALCAKAGQKVPQGSQHRVLCAEHPQGRWRNRGLWHVSGGAWAKRRRAHSGCAAQHA